MTDAMDRIVIVGAGVTGVTAAMTLREEGFDGGITLVGEEPVPPYERPPLSKEILRGEQTIEQASLHAADVYHQRDIDLRIGVRVDSIDSDTKTLVLEGGETLAYDALLLATGLRNRRLSVPGIDLAGIGDIRTIADVDGIRGVLDGGASRAVVVGMGFIGAEAAASLRMRGLGVTIVEMAGTALERVLGTTFGRVVEDIHRDHGVVMRFNEGVERFVGTDRLEAVVTSSGAEIAADLAIVGVGTAPEITLAVAAGIACDDGVLVDAAMRTNLPGIWAAGDVANVDHPRYGRLRVEHFDSAGTMGAVAARSILGRDAVFDDILWFWSDQYDTGIQMAGRAPDGADIVIRGSLDERSFVAFSLADGIVQQVVGIGRNRDVRRTMPLIRDRVPVDPAALADDAVDLRELRPA